MITGLLNPSRLWDFPAMKLRAVMRWLLVVTIATGVAIGPAAPAMAATPPAVVANMKAHAAHQDGMQMQEGMQMPDMPDMPCCPRHTKAKDCDGCPFAALCTLSISPPVPSGPGVLIERYPLRTAFAPIDDQLIDGLGAKPPDHPPRTIV
jgi:hypothetical protein